MNDRNDSLTRSRWAAIGAAVAVAVGAGGLGIAQATTSSGERPIYTAIEPCRLVDVRSGAEQVGPRSAPLGPAETFTLDGWGSVGDCELPTGTSALALNVTALDATQPTFLTLFPAGGELPTASHLNPVPGQPPAPNAVNVSLNDAGEFSVYNFQGTVNVIVDVVGIYDDHNHDDRYYTKAQTDAAIDADIAALVDGAQWRESLPVSDMFWYESPNVGFQVVGGGSSGTDGLWMNETGYARFHGGFALPPEYQPGSNFRIDITWAAETTNSNCNFYLELNSLGVARDGLRTMSPDSEFESAAPVADFSFPDIELAAPPSPGAGNGFLLTNQATWLGVSGVAMVGTDEVMLQPGDHVRFAFNRDPADLKDTCADSMIITGMSATGM